MARILYFSTHEPLEYDDIRLFQSMGHTVFSLGNYCPAKDVVPKYRPKIEYNKDTMSLVNLFNWENCECAFTDLSRTKLTSNFINSFDIIISIQDPGFIVKFWDIIDGPVVVWRTVGQAIDHFDAVLAPYRDKGMCIVRWSGREVFAQTYIGHDAIVRAYKDPQEYGPWSGKSEKIITFSNSYKERYPIEHGMFERVTYLLNSGIGGMGNDDLQNALGLLDTEGLRQTMNDASSYFYMHGSVVPYTLNFIEAMMTGVPVVAAGRNVEIHNIDMRYNEINDFIVHGHNGFLFKSEKEARGILMNLSIDKDYARMIGAAGRETAIRLFSRDRAAADWGAFFRAVM